MELTVQAPPTIASLDERRLLRAARAGDADAFLALVRPHDRALRGLAYRLLGDAELMDDALQSAYLAAFRSLRSFRSESSVTTWLYRIAYNACLDELRRRRRRPEVPLSEAADGRSPDPADVVAGRIELGGALATLSADVRAAVLLVDGDGLSYGDASEVLGVAEGTVASRLHTGRAALRRLLGHHATEEDDDDAA